jgi:hypothetical protein
MDVYSAELGIRLSFVKTSDFWGRGGGGGGEGLNTPPPNPPPSVRRWYYGEYYMDILCSVSVCVTNCTNVTKKIDKTPFCFSNLIFAYFFR